MMFFMMMLALAGLISTLEINDVTETTKVKDFDGPEPSCFKQDLKRNLAVCTHKNEKFFKRFNYDWDDGKHQTSTVVRGSNIDGEIFVGHTYGDFIEDDVLANQHNMILHFQKLDAQGDLLWGRAIRSPDKARRLRDIKLRPEDNNNLYLVGEWWPEVQDDHIHTKNEGFLIYYRSEENFLQFAYEFGRTNVAGNEMLSTVIWNCQLHNDWNHLYLVGYTEGWRTTTTRAGWLVKFNLIDEEIVNEVTFETNTVAADGVTFYDLQLTSDGFIWAAGYMDITSTGNGIKNLLVKYNPDLVVDKVIQFFRAGVNNWRDMTIQLKKHYLYDHLYGVGTTEQAAGGPSQALWWGMKDDGTKLFYGQYCPTVAAVPQCKAQAADVDPMTSTLMFFAVTTNHFQFAAGTTDDITTALLIIRLTDGNLVGKRVIRTQGDPVIPQPGNVFVTHIDWAPNGFLHVFGTTNGFTPDALIDEIKPGITPYEGNYIYSPFLMKSDMEFADTTCDHAGGSFVVETPAFATYGTWDVSLDVAYIEHVVTTNPSNPHLESYRFLDFGGRSTYECWAYMISMPAYTYEWNDGTTGIDEQFQAMCQVNNLGIDIQNYQIIDPLTGAVDNTPAGLTWNLLNRTITGTANTPGVYLYKYFDRVLIDADWRETATPVKIVIHNNPPTAVGTIVLPNPTEAVGAAFNYPLDVPSFFTDGDAADATLHYTFHLLSGEGIPDWMRIDLTTKTISGTPPKTSDFVVEIRATDSTLNVATQQFRFIVTNIDLRVNEVQEDVCVFLNQGPSSYVHDFSTSFYDEDENSLTMSIDPNNTVEFTGATVGSWLRVNTVPDPAVTPHLTTKVSIKGKDLFGTDLEQFVLFTVIPRQVKDTGTDTVSNFYYNVADPELKIKLTDLVDYDFSVSLSDGGEIPSFMIPKIDTADNSQFLSVETANYTDGGKYYLKGAIKKYGCLEEIYFTVEINTPPIVQPFLTPMAATPDVPAPAAQTVYIYEDIETKVNLGATDLYEKDSHKIIDVKHYRQDGTNPEVFESPASITDGKTNQNFDFDLELQIFHFKYQLADSPIQMVTQATDELDQTSWYYWEIIVLANNAPTTTIPGPSVHTVNAGAPFAFTHIATLFTDADIATGDSISAVYMTWGADKLPGWMSYNGATYNYAGVAPKVQVQTTYLLQLWAFDSRGAKTSYDVQLIVEPNKEPSLDNTDFEVIYSVWTESYFEIVFPKNTMKDPEGVSIIYTMEGSATNGPWPEWMTFHTYNRTLNGFPPRDLNQTSYQLKLHGSDGVGGRAEMQIEVRVKQLDYMWAVVLMGAMLAGAVVLVGAFIVHALFINITKADRAAMGLDRTDFYDEMMKRYEVDQPRRTFTQTGMSSPS